ASAQNIGPLPPLTAHVDVNVVNVDVTVTSADGRPVMDLTKDDFGVFEDARLQKLPNLSIIENPFARPAKKGAASAPAAAEVRTDVRRKILLLVDNNYLEKQERDVA